MNNRMNQFQLQEKNFTILIVDDTESNVKLLSFVLKEAGYNIIAAFNGKEALNLISKRTPDLILMDVLMPDMSGYEVTSRIKQQSEFNATPIIYITALSDLDDKLRAFNSGGVDFITKPFQKEEVLARIKTHLFLQHLLRERDSRIDLLKKQEQELRDLQKKKSELIRVVSHDIYNPLLSIHGISELINDSNSFDDEAEQLIDLITNSSQKLLTLVDRILNDDTHLELSQEVNVEPFSLSDLISRIIELNQPKAVLKKVSFDSSINVKEEIFYFDEIKLEIALNNLVSNALKFTPSGGSVKISAFQHANSLELRVSDNGIGIPNHLIDHIFASNDSKINSDTDSEISVGLGLDIVQEYIQMQNGTIKVSSEIYNGTEFVITLPLQ